MTAAKQKPTDDKVEESDFTVMELNKQIDMSDLKTKVGVISQLVKKKNSPIKVIVKVDPLNKIEVAKANFLLHSVADQLSSVGIVKKITSVQEFPDFPHESLGGEDEESIDAADVEARIERETEPGEIDLEDAPKKRRGKKVEAPLKDNARLGYVAVEVVPRTNKVTAATIEWIVEKLGSVENIMKKVTEKRAPYYCWSFYTNPQKN